MKPSPMQPQSASTKEQGRGGDYRRGFYNKSGGGHNKPKNNGYRNGSNTNHRNIGGQRNDMDRESYQTKRE